MNKQLEKELAERHGQEWVDSSKEGILQVIRFAGTGLVIATVISEYETTLYLKPEKRAELIAHLKSAMEIMLE